MTTFTIDDLKNAAKRDGIDLIEIVPINWGDTVRRWPSNEAPLALLAYIRHQEIGRNLAELIGDEPESTHEFSRTGSGDYCAYILFADDSLWYVNNAEDEVWVDYTDFVGESLIPGIEASNACGGGCFTEEEYDESDNERAWKLDGMDRCLLLHYCDDDEAKARELIGF